MSSDAAFFDLSAVLDRFGGDLAFARECSDLLTAELPGLISQIEESVRAQAPDRLLRAAHTLKGALSNFVSDGPTKTAAVLERLGREANLDAAGDHVVKLKDEIALLLQGLGELSSEPATN
jgi:HPt (histidine-containing phosphotransfer) domain-containing protein